MNPTAERDTLNNAAAVSAMTKHFKPSDIEELSGIEFYRIVLGNESIEQLEITVQRLGMRAFPSMNEKEFLQGSRVVSSKPCR